VNKDGEIMNMKELYNKADYKDKLGMCFKGDCLEVMKDIPDKSVDMILCDLPYGITACKWDTVIPLEPLWAEYKRIIKDNGAIVLFGSQPFTSVLIMSNIKEYKATWYWKKERGTNFVQAKRYPMKVIEDCLLFCKGTPTYNPVLREVKPYSHVLPKPKNGSSQHMDSKSVDSEGNRIYKTYNTAYPINVLEFSRDNMAKGKSLHPTQKPVALLEYLIKTHTNEGEIVLDNCMGSGSTCVACKNLNRRYIGIELDDNYFDIAINRLNK
jgi:site-specific DNA-methyltransferase (adenine-specific)